MRSGSTGEGDCMKRILRILINGLTVLSLLLCVATVILWAQSGRRQHSWYVGWGGKWIDNNVWFERVTSLQIIDGRWVVSWTWYKWRLVYVDSMFEKGSPEPDA